MPAETELMEATGHPNGHDLAPIAIDTAVKELWTPWLQRTKEFEPNFAWQALGFERPP